MRLPRSTDDWSNLASWERVVWALDGIALPNTNGLIRRYLPKRQSMVHLTQHD